MSISIGAIVILAAFMHALWNAMVKGAGDKTVMLGLIALGHVLIGTVLVTISTPPDISVMPYVIATTVIHWGYYYLLNVAYRLGDLSVVYPIARGLTPVLIAIGALIWVGEVLSFEAWAGLGLVSVGIMVLAAGILAKNAPMTAILAALGVALTIAAYSVVDGIGVRISGSIPGYIGWIFLAEGFVATFVFLKFWPRVKATSPGNIRLGIVGGLISGGAYGLVLYAKAHAALGIVSALRETSVIFAAIIGVLWFGEGPVRRRIFSAVIVLAGVVLIGLNPV
ncbi:MAG: EamA family transporter [Rhodobacteraceae bacterium]|nr:EamA family transporter [Paracoccaceae bacterium]